MMVGRMRVPLGVILMIYEARPHVTVNAGAFSLKSGNAVILKGGREALQCNTIIGDLWTEALSSSGMPADAVQVISASHEEVAELLRLPEYIDVVVPRGGKGLIKSVVENETVLVIDIYAEVTNI